MTHARLAPDSIGARIAIGMIPTTGILYSWVTPLIVSALEQNPNISAEAAGYVFSANMYGTAIGGLLAIAITRTLPWRTSCTLLVLWIASMDLISIWLLDPAVLAMVRFGHGLAGGLLMGFGALILTRAGKPERTLSIMLALQTLFGGAILVGLAPLIASLGVYPIWISLILVALICLSGLRFLSDYPDPATSAGSTTSVWLPEAPRGVLLLTMLALFIYQATQMTAYVYVFELGQSYALSNSFLGLASGISIWIGGVAALFTAFWSTRSGYVSPVIAAGLLSALSVTLLAYPSAITYFIASVGFAFFFTITIVYMLALFSVMDNTGRFATVGSFINTFGLASGPMLAATLLSLGFNYVNLIWFGALGMTLACSMALYPGRHAEHCDRTLTAGGRA